MRQIILKGGFFMEEKYQVVGVTFINENGERITCNMETGSVTPEGLSRDTQMKALLYTGVFIGAGDAALRKIWGEA